MLRDQLINQNQSNIFYTRLQFPGLVNTRWEKKNYLTYFLTTEAILLVGAYSLDYYSVSLLNNALNYAENKAGYSGKEKSREFILAMGSHNSLSDYNIAMRQQRNLNAVFPENDPIFIGSGKIRLKEKITGINAESQI